MARPIENNKILADHGEWLEIDISTPTHPIAVMFVDSDAWDTHPQYRVGATTDPSSKYIYAKYTINNKLTSFHRIVVDAPDGMYCDHIKHGTMEFIDNRRSNLRIVSGSQNCMNRGLMPCNVSGCAGVNWDKQSGSWYVSITKDRKKIHLGSFDNIEIAIGVRKQAERELFGEYAYQGGTP